MKQINVPDRLSTLFFNGQPSCAVAYYGGDWLPANHVLESQNYFNSLDYPLQILEIPEKREMITSNLLNIQPKNTEIKPQQSLFSENKSDIPGKEHLELIIEGLLSLTKNKKSLYKRWSQNVSGKIRELSVPQKALNELLNFYVHPILMLAPCHENCHGAEKGWSVKKSLQSHLPLRSVLSFDISDAFGNTHLQYVFNFYYDLLKKLVKRESVTNVAGFLSSISTVCYKHSGMHALPVGSPISTHLFNRIWYPIDRLLEKQTKKKNLKCSRWIDDVIISSEDKNCPMEEFAFALNLVKQENLNFPINGNKVFFQNGDEIYLLGHKISGKSIMPVENKDYSKGTLVPSHLYNVDPEEFYLTKEF